VRRRSKSRGGDRSRGAAVEVARRRSKSRGGDRSRGAAIEVVGRRSKSRGGGRSRAAAVEVARRRSFTSPHESAANDGAIDTYGEGANAVLSRSSDMGS
jgi:hypothetical protein